MVLIEAALLFFVGDFRTVTVRGVLIKSVSFGLCQLFFLLLILVDCDASVE